jgi:ligand-binding sensor domain-containing protein
MLFSHNDIIWYSAKYDFGGLYNDKQGKLLDGYFSVQAIAEDKENNLWVTTEGPNTIQKFDTKTESWQTFDTNNAPINKRSILLDIQVDSNNNIWTFVRYGISAKDHILLKYDHQKWVEYKLSELFSDTDKSFIYNAFLLIDKKNNIWIGTNQGLIKFNEGNTNVSTFEEEGITLFPNPTNDILNIDLSNQQAISYTITNIEGKIIKQEHRHFSKHFTIDTKTLKTGTYFIKLNLYGKQIVQSKFVKGAD